MIKYHGTPLTPKSVFNEVMPSRNCLIPFPHPQNLKQAIELCNKIIVDNGAFTLWKQGGTINWNDYYLFIDKVIHDIDFFFIPDVIDGTEEENDKLIMDFFKEYSYYHDEKVPMQIQKAIPIWHINESFDRLQRLMDVFNYIAIGSAGEYRDLGTKKWHERMNEAMKIFCDEDGFPKVKIHMLRCLNPKIFIQYPFYSGDSTNLARNHKRDTWIKIISRIEKHDSPKRYIFKNYYKA